VTVCYLRDRRDEVFAIDDRARHAGVDYVEITERHSFDPGVWPALRQLVRERRIDIVHAHDYKTDLLALALARTEGIIPLSTVHGWSGHTFRETLLYYPADRWLLRAFPRVIAVSSTIQGTLLKAGVQPSDVAVVPNGIDPWAYRRDRSRDVAARQALGLDASVAVVGAVGRLEHEKRYDLLIEAVARVHRERPSIRLVFIGSGSLEPSLRAHASRLGVESVCIFAGQRADVRDVYPAFDLFVQSSDTEGTSNAVLEAMAMEVPIVATAVGGTADLITDGRDGLLVPKGDVDALADAVVRTLSEPAATARRVDAARRRVEHELSFATRMKTVEGIYADLVAGAARDVVV
jgi:glycosyltransferase involved in cell wall biosynthesis